MIITQTFRNPPASMVDLFEVAQFQLSMMHKEELKHLASNYDTEKLFDPEIVCYSLSTLDEYAVSGSVAYAREFYNGAVRVCTKYYVSPLLDVLLKEEKGLRPDSYYKNGLRTYLADQIDQQIDFCTDLGYTKFFTSRDHPSYKLNKRICDGMNNNCKNKGWKITEEKMLVAPNPSDLHCWQHVIYKDEYPL